MSAAEGRHSDLLIGHYHPLHGEKAAARGRFEDAVRVCASGGINAMLAAQELKRL